MDSIFFKNAAEMREWFEKNYIITDELWLGLYKKSSGKIGISYKESVDQALCFGWIDGISKSIDDNRYKQRFTPRRKKSIWSLINIQRVGELKKMGLMHEHGLKVFKERDPKRTKMYSFEQKEISFDAQSLKKFQSHAKAWAYFHKQAPGYQRAAIWWVISAKKEETKQKHLDILIEDSENEVYIKPLRRR